MNFNALQCGDIHALILVPERKLLLHPLFETEFFDGLRRQTDFGIFAVIFCGINGNILLFKFILINFNFERIVAGHNIAAFGELA
ncbi:hypothetical protein D3C72_2154970 [compost metagenome]